MSQIYFISDTHLGSRYWASVRGFSSPASMDDWILQNWVNTVKPGDSVYHLGDVANNSHSLAKLKDVPGRKILVKGSHDIFKLKYDVDSFKDIRALHQVDFGINNVIFTHIPIAKEQLECFQFNVHGHVHQIDKTSPADLRYINICFEQRIKSQKDIFVPIEEIDEKIKLLI